ncbi:uncharacterized protein METZ01_LOCUS96473 [marine metagenome]|uniref:Uncharacterized protein n=1 Tax=marine metagenome TaxID=408172 RepID=A0A381VTI8_9ZZZZ
MQVFSPKISTSITQSGSSNETLFGMIFAISFIIWLDGRFEFLFSTVIRYESFS